MKRKRGEKIEEIYNKKKKRKLDNENLDDETKNFQKEFENILKKIHSKERPDTKSKESVINWGIKKKKDILKSYRLCYEGIVIYLKLNLRDKNLDYSEVNKIKKGFDKVLEEHGELFDIICKGELSIF